MLALLYGGLFGLVMAVLSIRVPMRRFATGIAWGDGGDPELATRIRVFGNFIEYVPFILLLMLMIEMAGGAAWFLHAAGLILLAMRLLHAVSLRASGAVRAHRIGRGVAAAMTWLVLLACAVYAVALGLPVIG
ncbi:MAPEG family protein [Marinibaculum pumilum]|uniref:MAPEG family protein n=1 Tax=Marinibaculum pumilum TaxID=1766165 RepID=A0ABV7L366_9PROT